MATYSDNFNRANGALGASWGTPTGATAFTVSANTARASAVCVSYWVAAVGADQFSEIGPVISDGAGVAVRIQSGNKAHYRLTFQDDSTGLVPFLDYVNSAGTVTPLWTGGPYLQPGNPIHLDATGSTLTVKYNGAVQHTHPHSALTTGQPGIASAYGPGNLDDWSGGDIVVQAVPGSGPFAAGQVTLSGNLGGVVGVSVGFPAGQVSLSGSLGEKHGTTGAFAAGQVSLSGDIGGTAKAVAPTATYTDNFDSYPAGQPISGTWASWTGAPPLARGGGIGPAASAGGTACYRGALPSNQYSQITPSAAGLDGRVAVGVRTQTGAWAGYFGWVYNNLDGTYTATICNGAAFSVPTGAFSASAVFPSPPASSKLRIEAAEADASSPVRVRFYVDDTLVLEAWDAGHVYAQMLRPPARGGYAGVALSGSDSTVLADNWSAGVVGSPPAIVPFPAGVVTLSGNMGQPVPCVAGMPAGPVSLSGSMGQPIPCTAGLPAGSVSLSGSMGAVISRAKQTTIFPSFSAYGGLDSYTGQPKGQICADGDRTIGYRVGVGNDGVAGDRVFLTVPAPQLVRADTPTNPVGKATLHVTFLTMMSWDYLATGNAANPSGVAFKIRKADDPSRGMNATLTGDYGTINAKPIWLSGQTWYDGTTRGNPVWQAEVDITALYNESAQAGADLVFCLECQFTDTKWVAEIAGTETPWAKPRIEVHRWGAADIQIADTNTCTPTITVTPPAGGTVTRIQWGYDEKLTPQGGVFKYRPATFSPSVVEGVSASSPYTLPMLESSQRVHAEIEVDFGAKGSLIFKRTWKTPQAFAPRLETRPDLYAPTSGPDIATEGWLDVRGPFPAPSTAYADVWYMLAKKLLPAWTPTTVFKPGACVSSGGCRWYTPTGGTSGTAGLPAPSSAATIAGASDGAMTWLLSTRQNFTASGADYGTEDVYPYRPGEPGTNYWELYRCTNYQDTFAFKHFVGVFAPTDYGRPDPIWYPAFFDANFLNLGTRCQPGPDIAVDADDVSVPVYDPATQCNFFLGAKLNTGTGLWDVRAYCLSHQTNSAESDWRFGNWSTPWRTSALLYSATAQPDLANCGTVTVTADWRYSLDGDPFARVVAAFVADGNLRVYSTRMTLLATSGTSTGTYDQQIAAANFLDYNLKNTTWTQEQSVAVTTDEVRVFHHLTLAGKHSLVIAARGSPGWIGARSDDVVTFNDGGGYTLTPGTWTARADLSFARAWPTETMVADSNGHIPDAETCSIAVQATDGSVTMYGTNLQPAAGFGLAIAPAADFGTTQTWNWKKRVVGRWPALTGYGPTALTGNGGCVNFKVSGSTLTAQRVCDFLRVSDETSITLPSAIQAIHVQRDLVWEGQKVPVVTQHADGFRVSLVTVGTDLHRLYLPTPDQVARFSSGAVTGLLQDSPNMRAPADVKRLAGHNTFITGWTFDPVVNPLGMMNEAGWNYLAFDNCDGETIRLLVHDSPAFGGKWRDKTLHAPTYDSGYQPEAIGGAEWMQMKMATWWWTNDPPSKPDRQWHRVLDGMDYVLDGESAGGAYVVVVKSYGPKLWLAHDVVSDIPTWEGDVAGWMASPNASLIKWTDAQGQLLEPDGAVLSQVERVP